MLNLPLFSSVSYTVFPVAFSINLILILLSNKFDWSTTSIVAFNLFAFTSIELIVNVGIISLVISTIVLSSSILPASFLMIFLVVVVVVIFSVVVVVVGSSYFISTLLSESIAICDKYILVSSVSPEVYFIACETG